MSKKPQPVPSDLPEEPSALITLSLRIELDILLSHTDLSTPLSSDQADSRSGRIMRAEEVARLPESTIPELFRPLKELIMKSKSMCTGYKSQKTALVR